MIVIKLKEAMLAYYRRTGQKLTYDELAQMTGIPAETLRSISSRLGYHCSVARIEILCRTLDVPLHDMMEVIDDPPKAKKKTKRSTKKSKKKGV